MWSEKFIAQRKAMEKWWKLKIQYLYIADSMLDASLFRRAFSPNKQKHITEFEDVQRQI